MALFKLSNLKFLHRQPLQPKVILTPPSTGQAITPQPSSPLQPKSITQLERQMEEEQRLRIQFTHPLKNAGQHAAPQIPQGSPLKKVVVIALLCGIPIGLIWLVNLPYSVIRRPVSETIPILLLPSYISLDHHYRIAITTLEQAQQLIDKATAPVDLDLGEQKLHQAQKSLDAIPVGWVGDPLYSYSWYDWRFSPSSFNAARTEAGRLQGKVFQEKNAQNVLFEAEQSLAAAQQKYPQAKTAVDRQTAIAQWQTAIDQLEQIPGGTLAGKSAQQKLPAYQRDFQEIVGLAAGNQHTLMLLSTAREYSQRAAVQAQNPPHTTEEWQQIARLWEDAIAQVELIHPDDLTGYAEAQKMRAEYQQNLGQIKIRLESEDTSVRAFEEAQGETVNLLAIASPTDRNYTIKQLQSIINKLEQVQDGTTVYLKAQSLLVSAQNKLNKFR